MTEYEKRAKLAEKAMDILFYAFESWYEPGIGGDVAHIGYAILADTGVDVDALQHPHDVVCALKKNTFLWSEIQGFFSHEDGKALE